MSSGTSESEKDTSYRLSPKTQKDLTSKIKAEEKRLMRNYKENLKDIKGKKGCWSLSPLLAASLGGHASTVTVLLKAGANIGSQDEFGQTALYIACRGGHTEAAQVLLEEGKAPVDSAALTGWTPLMASAHKGHKELVHLLLRHGANVHKMDIKGHNALFAAVSGGHEEIVEVLIMAGALPDLSDKAGAQPIMFAATKGHLAIVERLLRPRPVMLRVLTGAGGKTALYFAAQNGNIEIVDTLLEAGAFDDGGFGLVVASAGGHASVVRRLIEVGGKVTSVDENGLSCLYAAAAAGHTETVDALLSLGADVDATPVQGFTPLAVACIGGHSACAQKLLESGANVHVRTADKLTILMRTKEISVVTVLLEAGADVSALDSDGRGVLHWAAYRGCGAPVLCSLVKAGADPRAVNIWGDKPADVARRKGFTTQALLLDRLAEQAETAGGATIL